MNIGIYGGSFDPPHLAHLIFAEYACETLSLDKVLFVPAYRSPFKDSIQGNSIAIRCELVQLAINDNPRFELSLFEAERGGISYTVDTLRHFAELYPGAALTLLIGGDAFADLPRWKNPEEIMKLARIGVAIRPGSVATLGGLPYEEFADIVPMPQMDISATEIRDRVRNGKSIQYLVPWQVKTFIDYKNLYK